MKWLMFDLTVHNTSPLLPPYKNTMIIHYHYIHYTCIFTFSQFTSKTYWFQKLFVPANINKMVQHVSNITVHLKHHNWFPHKHLQQMSMTEKGSMEAPKL